ncbi:MAG: aminopeptidase P family protein [Phycisphaerales bacterium]|nr:MAG: aminopeptidase P family protein [Phycisphaerales bacterium]
MVTIIEEKVQQAQALLESLDLDCWLTFVRETVSLADPALPLILGQHLTWQSALIITRKGERIAIVGNFDADAVKTVGVWNEIIPYTEGVSGPLRETLGRLDPRQVAVNYSRDDIMADGLTHGMYLLLTDYLKDTPYLRRLVPADAICGALRGCKTPGEVQRIRAAIAATEQILEQVSRFARVGRTEIDVAQFVKGLVSDRKLELAWEPKQCPIVNTGPDSMIGHGIPAELKIEPGHLFHIDFGVRQEDYCADLQRMWYVPRAGETKPPERTCRAFDTVRKAIEAAKAALRPGVECWEVDAAARKVVVDAGYPEYGHGTGHQVGRAAHDGGGILGPKWERYGKTPYRKVESGNVFTLELGVMVEGHGYVGLEDMVLVTADGCEYLSHPQTELCLLGA